MSGFHTTKVKLVLAALDHLTLSEMRDAIKEEFLEAAEVAIEELEQKRFSTTTGGRDDN